VQVGTRLDSTNLRDMAIQFRFATTETPCWFGVEQLVSSAGRVR
jgi:hypothetical protein